MVEWKSLQKVANNISLKDLIKDEFMELINDEFEDKNVEIDSIQFSLRDKQIDSDSTLELVSLFHRNLEDVLLEKVVVDVDSEDNMGHIVNVIDKWDDK